MSPEREKLHRLARLKAIRTAAAKAAEQRVSALNSAARAAEERRRLVLDLLSSSGSQPGPASQAMLSGGASLRLMLQDALHEATSRSIEKSRARDAAVEILAHAQGRRDRTADDLASALLHAASESEERERDDRVPAIRKPAP